MLGWASCGFHKKCVVTPTCVFASVVFVGLVLHSCASGASNVDALFFMLRWIKCSFNKYRAGTRHAELVFLHPKGSAGHIVHSGSSGARIVDGLFFMLRWAWYGLYKQCTGTLRRTYIFASSGICGSGSAFWCVWAVKHRHIIFNLSGTCIDSTKSALRHLTPSFCFCIRWNLRVTYCIPVHPSRATSMHYLSCSSGPGAVSIASVSGHVTPNSSFCIRWDLWVTKCISVCPGREMLRHYFSCSGGTSTCVFAFGGIYRSRSTFWCIWGMKHRRTIFYALVGLVQFP
jgi:hypothetical protein